MDELEEEQPIYKYAKPFGKKEKVLNYTSNAYQLTRPSKVGAVMELIRECQPKTFQEWRQYYFEKAHTKTKVPIKVTQDILNELGERLYEKITEVVIPEWTEAFKQITKQDCYDYVYEVTIPRTFDGYLTEKSVINDFLAKKFPDVVFEEADSDLDHSGDIDYICKIGDKAFGIQIKPVTANSNFGNYNLSERMRANFESFEERYGGKVFIVFSSKVGNKKEVKNKEILDQITAEIARLK
jgi:MjaI restriction endonuclease